MRHSLLTLLCLSLLPAGLAAQTAAAGKNTPASEETGEPEGNDHSLPPRRLDPRIWTLKDPLLLDIARRVEAGTASLPMARSFDRLYTRLFPFKTGVPDGWRERAARAERALRAVRFGGAGSLAAGTQATTLTWALLGPPNYANGADNISGRATAIWVDPANKNTIILGTADGGLWKTTDQGVNWASLSANLPTLSIGSIAVDPANSSVIYAGTGEGNFSADGVGGMGIFKSADGGISWVQLPQPAWPYGQPYHNVRRIVVDPRNSQFVYAAVDGGLYFSANGGTNWTLTGFGVGGTPIATDVIVDAVTPAGGSPSIVYVAIGYIFGGTANGIFRNTDGNLGTTASWTKISAAPATGFPASPGRITLVSAPSDRKQLYALTGTPTPSGSLGIFYTADATAATVAWAAKSVTNYCNAQCWYDMHGTVDPTTPSKLFVGGLDDYISTDSATTLTQVSSWTGTGANFSHADHHFLVMPDATTLYDANDGGFFIGTVTGTTVNWINRNNGLATLQFYGFAQHPTDATKIHGGLQDNGDAYYNGTSWNEVYGGDGGKAAWDQSNASYAYEEYVYASISRNSNMTGTPFSWTCIRNFGGCANCSGGCSPDGATAFISPFTLDANDQNILYAGSNRVYRNTAARTGNAWTAISVSFGTAITAFHSAKNNGVAGTLYAGVGVGAQMTANANTGAPPATWINIGAGLPGGTVTSFTTDPTNGQKVLVTTSGYGATGHVFRSTAGGAGWVNISGTLPSVPFSTIVLSPSDVNHAYAGSDFGVYENTAVWTTNIWTSLQGNLPLVAVDELSFNPLNGKLRAATHGRSAWELTLATVVANPVPDGSFIAGTPLKAAKGAGANIGVTFDTTTCTPGGYNAYWGNLSAAALSTYTYSGSQCAVTSGGNITSIPSATSAFFVIVGTDGATAESRNVQDSAGVWHGSGVGLCAITSQSATTTCP